MTTAFQIPMSFQPINVNRFFVFDGIDNVGKTTIANKVSEMLGSRCTLLSFPDRNTFTGEFIYKILADGDISDHNHLGHLFAMNRYEVMKTLGETDILIADRYISSNVAFGVGSMEQSLEFAMTYDYQYLGLPIPDLTFIVTRDEPFVSDTMDYYDMNTAIQEKANSRYQKMILEDTPISDKWLTLNNNYPSEKQAEYAYEMILQTM